MKLERCPKCRRVHWRLNSIYVTDEVVETLTCYHCGAPYPDRTGELESELATCKESLQVAEEKISLLKTAKIDGRGQPDYVYKIETELESLRNENAELKEEVRKEPDYFVFGKQVSRSEYFKWLNGLIKKNAELKSRVAEAEAYCGDLNFDTYFLRKILTGESE